ncbi:MAG: hypothetical protein MUO87_04085 [Thermoplasmata archaeon]|nr:hypothetical protein [Thermoplasmata archaeon]
MKEPSAGEIVQSINKVGYPFQRRVAKGVMAAGWRVSFEHETRFFTGMSEEFRTKIDVLADLGIVYSSIPSVSAIVECKRRDAERVKWLFFSRVADTLDTTDVLERFGAVLCSPDKIGKDGIIYGYRVEHMQLSVNKISHSAPKYDYYLQRKGPDKVKPDDIEEAFFQVAVGLRGAMREMV